MKTTQLRIRHILLLTLFFGGFRQFSLGQGACFNFVGDSVGCAPFTVKVRSCADPSAIISFNFKWKPNPNPTDYQTLPSGETDATFSYTEPGEYTIEQLRGGNQTLQRKVRVFSFEARPIFQRSTCRDTLILTFSDTVFSAYSFDPGDGSGTIIIADRSRPFKYKYNFIGNSATYSYVLKGERPATCNRDPISGTISLYKNDSEPVSDSLIGLDTLKYKVRIQTRADEPFGFQLGENSIWTTPFSDQTEEDDPTHIDTLQNPQIRQNSKIRAVTLNGCGNLIPAPEWTVLWVKTESDNQRINLSWPRTSIPDLVGFELLRNGAPLKNLLGLPDTSLTDSSNLVCGETYCYQIRTRRQVPGHAGQMVFVSAPICAQAISNRPPDPVRLLTATVVETGIQIKGIASPLAKTFELYRKEKEADVYDKIGNFSQLPLTDTSARTQTTAYCYRITYRDICDNQSLFSDSICPILLRLTTPDESEKDFTWTEFLGWKEGVEKYELVRTTQAASDNPASTDMGLGLSYQTKQRDKVGQRVFYRIRALPKNQNLYPDSSYSNKVENIQKSKLRFPDVFTPNEDSENDEFRCYSLFITNFEMRIYNAWGNIVFATNKIDQGWRGIIDAKPAPSGPYAYWAKGTDEEGNPVETRGLFNLIR